MCRKRPTYNQWDKQKRPIHVKRDLQKRHICINRDQRKSHASEPQICPKRPIYIKRDLYARSSYASVWQMCQKRPVYIKRDLQKRRIWALLTRKRSYVYSCILWGARIWVSFVGLFWCIQVSFDISAATSIGAYCSLSYDTCVKETFKRDLYTTKETYMRAPRTRVRLRQLAHDAPYGTCLELSDKV